MLSVVLSVLKIIGIVLLSILLFVLALILLFLFWPFFYRVDLNKKEAFEGTAKLSWFFHLVVVEALFGDGFNLRVKVLGIPFYDKKKKDEKSRDESISSKKGEAIKLTEDLPKDKVEIMDFEEAPAWENAEVKPEAINEKKESLGFEEESSKENKKAKAETGETPKKSFREKISLFFERVLEFLEALPDKIDEICEKIESKIDELIELLVYYDNLFSKKGTAWVIDFCKKEIILLLKHLKPYKISIMVDHASKDPEKVAKMYQYYGMALPFLPKKTKFASNFGEEKMNFELHMKGKFFLFYIIYHALKLVLNKKVKKFIKLLKREEM